MKQHEERLEALRNSNNPIFSSTRKLKLGTFSTNLSGGGTMSSMTGLLKAEWPITLELARLADDMEFEAIVPVGRWKGFGGDTNFNGSGFEGYSWAAGVTASTRQSSVFATSHLSTVHPLFAAKQAATIDHIGNGRFTLNLVTGWFTPELQMFGLPEMEHEARYELAEEWVEIVKRLWQEDEPFDFEGRYFKLKQAELSPKPIQRPYPALMNAAGSERGRHFAAKHCDVAFVPLDSHDPEKLRKKVETYKNFAREVYGREIQVWSNAYVFHGDTDEDAQRLWNHCVHELGDWEGVNNMTTVMGMTSRNLPPQAYEFVKQHFIAGWCGYPLIGAANRIADGLEVLHNAGFDGIILTWPRWVEGMERFRTEVLPLLVQAGLR
ncbi:LLM class flavin-dependent oxidoreductase [Paraburkholderia antibiotica]|uniref:LLM class flavin-dependent oxidoreductase n=1 Tax=Paraburkholderia antibiotica TaxID=2728839 RepID=A0A7X9ZYA4_9BURK|nr:LLM class flavin-dependent oxidoreductase [Paraburkholderia antibiotica]NML32949.1 LLM class flavin-dependent oxidoreductase [Paraburkholderia antibiotica]